VTKLNLRDYDNYKGAEWKLVHVVADGQYLVIAKNRIAVMQGNMLLNKYDRIGNKDTWVIPATDINQFFTFVDDTKPE